MRDNYCGVYNDVLISNLQEFPFRSGHIADWAAKGYIEMIDENHLSLNQWRNQICQLFIRPRAATHNSWSCYWPSQFPSHSSLDPHHVSAASLQQTFLMLGSQHATEANGDSKSAFSRLFPQELASEEERACASVGCQCRVCVRERTLFRFKSALD